MSILKLSFFSILCFISLNIFSQTETANNVIKQYHYTFSGDLSSQLKTELEKSAMQLSFATEAKIKYKAESKTGELFLFTKEKKIVSEGDIGFDIVALKKLILSYHITPQELTITQN